MQFEIGQTSLDVCRTIVDNHPKIARIRLITHPVGINWRQAYNTSELQAKNFLDGLKHENPINQKDYEREEFLDLGFDKLPELDVNQVWSMTSEVFCYDNKYRHMPMMNFHPEGLTLEDIANAIKCITNNKRGVLLDSGRNSHYYGDFLLEENEWPGFVGEFLGPCVLVSPRYIFHRLHDGYCSLRLTADKKYKTKIPKVIKIL